MESTSKLRELEAVYRHAVSTRDPYNTASIALAGMQLDGYKLCLADVAAVLKEARDMEQYLAGLEEVLGDKMPIGLPGFAQALRDALDALKGDS